MSTQLHDGLVDLATGAPTELSGAEDLWRIGTRRSRVRAASSGALVVVIALLAGTLGGAVTPRLTPPVASSSDVMRLPTEIRVPGKWEGAFDGPPGKLSAVLPAWRGSLVGPDEFGYAGIRASTGESRFLDLPAAVAPGGDIDMDIGPRLNADGRYLASWLTRPSAPDERNVVDGVAVYDAVTGQSREWRVESELGLLASHLVWMGPTLRWQASTITDISGQTITMEPGEAGVRSWNVVSGTKDKSSGRYQQLAALRGLTQDGFLSPQGRRRLLAVTPAGTTDLAVDRGVYEVTLSPSQDWLAALAWPSGGNISTPAPLWTGRVGDDGEVALGRLPGPNRQSLLGWRDENHVVVDQREGIVAVDVRSGESSTVARWSGPYAGAPSFAQDVWAAPVIAPPEAPIAPDPRMVGMGMGLLALTLILSVLFWRRRRATS